MEIKATPRFPIGSLIVSGITQIILSADPEGIDGQALQLVAIQC
jgi:hypothetical protein